MSRPDVLVLGAGPAGAALAGTLAGEGYRVEVWDPAPRPGTKPCGWAAPSQIEELINLPREAVLTEIRGFRVYLDGELVHEEHGRLWGYILDKPRLLEILLGDAALRRRGARLVPGPQGPTLPEPLEAGLVVIATGSQLYAARRPSWADMIYAVQAIFPWRSSYPDEEIQMFFDSSLVGYYWVFPRPGYGIDAGVGGYAEPGQLIERLRRFTRLLGLPEPRGVKGAWINIGGARPELMQQETPVIGEAAGYVYPLSGEGIRPSIASAQALAARLLGRPEPAAHRATLRWIEIQRRLLGLAVKASPARRAGLLRGLPGDLFTAIGLGSLTAAQLLKALPRLPRSIATVIRAALRPRRRGGED